MRNFATRALLTVIAVLSAPFIYCYQKVAKWVERHDPFDNRGLALSHMSRAYHRFGFQIATAIAAIAIATVIPTEVWASSRTVAHSESLWIGSGLGLANFAGATQQQKKYPFRYGTVRRRINIGTFTMTPGTQLPAVVIPQVGMLARILFDIEGSYTVANAQLVPAFADGMDALISQASIALNNGSAQIVQLSGVGINATNLNINESLPIKRGTPGAGNVNGTNLPLAVGAGNFSYKGFLPVNANQRRQFEMGLINLQAPELRATINLTFNPLASVFTVPANCTLFTATCNLSYEYYEIPNLNKYQLPPLTLVRTIEDAPAPINATGLQVYQIPRLGTMFDYHAVLMMNNVYKNVLPPLGAPTNGITEIAVRYNKTNVQHDVFIGDWETYEAELYGDGVGLAPTPSAATLAPQTLMSPFMISLNLWSAGDGERNVGDFRDGIDTEENTTTEMLITIGAGVALNAGKDNLFHVRRVVQRIAQAA